MAKNAATKKTDASAPPVAAVIPAPMNMVVHEGVFTLKSDTVILVDAATRPEADYLSKSLAPATGFTLAVRDLAPDAPKSNCIVMTLNPSAAELGEEGYKLSVSKDRIEASALRPAGVFYAAQTLRQLLPVEIMSPAKVKGVEWTLPCVSIEDKPRFAWRGHLFDCARHFFDVDTVKRSIDLLALHKMNRLHWHITEDQGWRLEIKRYPKLTEVGAWRNDKDTGKRYGGFYTQDEVRDILAYAAERHVVVVPEIEMPGHSSSVLASYPELGCTGGPYKVENWWGVFPDVYCAGNDLSYVFVKNVLDEVLELFPSQYIHIGGDECPKDRWKTCPKCQARIKALGLKDEHELQSHFVKQVDAYLTSRGRRLVGWDEILEGGLAPGAVVQSWRGIKGGIAAAEDGHDVIMSPTSHCYIDYSYVTTPVEKSYSFEPVPAELSDDKVHHVLGLEGNLWAEWVPNRDRLDYQAYPRLSALAEVGWSPKEKRDWKNFETRLAAQLKRFEIIGVKYGVDEVSEAMESATPIGKWTADLMDEKGVVLNWDASSAIDTPGKYEVFLVFKKGKAAISIEWVALLEDDKVIARDKHEGWSGGDKRDIKYTLDVPARKAGAKYVIQARVASMGGTESNGDVLIRKGK